MSGINIPANAAKDYLDSASDDPKLARPELADLVDKFNSLKGEVGSDHLQWPIQLSSVAYISTSSFSASDVSACHAGRRVQVVGATTGTVFATIDSVSGTTITITGMTTASGAAATLKNESLSAWVGVTGTASPAIPSPIVLNTYAQLKQIHGAPSVYVLGRNSAGDHAGGFFRWIPGNQSANITADPKAGLWVPPNSDTSGASGAWARITDGRLHINMFGPAADNSTDDSAVVKAAIAASASTGCELVFEAGKTYFLGNLIPSTHQAAVALTSAECSGARLDGQGCTLRVNTTVQDAAPTHIIDCTDPVGFAAKNFNFTDSGYNSAVDWKGATAFFFLSSGTVDGLGNLDLFDLSMTNGVALITVAGANAKRIRGIRFGNCETSNTYYGVVFQENGDNVVGQIRCTNARRAYFGYGVDNHRVTVELFGDVNAPGATAANYIKRYQRDTTNIALDLIFSGYIPQSYLVGIEHQTDDTASLIANVTLKIAFGPSYSNSAGAGGIMFSSLTAAGVANTTTSHRWLNTRISGNLGVSLAPLIDLKSTPSTEADVYLSGLPDNRQFNITPGAENFAFYSEWGAVTRIVGGDLTAKTVLIPLADLDGAAFALLVQVAAQGNTAQISPPNITYREDVLMLKNADGGPVSVVSSTNTALASTGTAVTVTYAGSGEFLAVTFAGAAYTISSVARVVTRRVLY